MIFINEFFIESVIFVPVVYFYSYDKIKLENDLLLFFHLGFAYFSLKYSPIPMRAWVLILFTSFNASSLPVAISGKEVQSAHSVIFTGRARCKAVCLATSL